MAEQQSPDSPGSSDAPIVRKKTGWWVPIAVVLGLLLAYQGVMFGVRKHVDSQIAKSVGETVLDFSLKDLDGTTWSAAELRGKTVVLNFFRSYCQSCLIEAPTMREFARTADPERVVVLGVMMDEVEEYAPETTQRTLEEMGYKHPVLMADAAFVDAFHGVGWSHVTPVTYIVDGKGRIATSLRGHQSLQTLREAVR